MTDKLPPNLLALFAPRPPLRWVPHIDVAPEKRRTLPVSGVAAFLPALAVYKDQDNYMPTESWLQMRDRKKLEQQIEVDQLLTQGPKKCECGVHASCTIAGVALQCDAKRYSDFSFSQTSRTRTRIFAAMLSRPWSWRD
jgi:alpha-D-ribose 1-methylphosphonate 5-triphosphate diphosphatase PhnM